MIRALAILSFLMTSALQAQFAGGTLGRPVDAFPGKRWGLVNHDGKPVVPFQFTSLQVSANGAMLVGNAQGKLAILKADGQLATPFEFDQGYLMAGDVIVVVKNQQRGVVDSSGNPIVPAEFEEVWKPDHDLLPVKQHGKWGWMDTRSHSLHFPEGHYDFMEVLGEDLVVGLEKERQRGTGFRRGGDQRWEMAISDWPTILDDSHFSARRGSSVRVYDHDGNESVAQHREKRTTTLRENGRFGLKDQDGHVAVPAKYDYLVRGRDGVCRASIKGEGWSLIRESGETITTRSYSSISEAGADGRYLAAETRGSGKWVFLDAAGRAEALPGQYCEARPALTSGLIPVREP